MPKNDGGPAFPALNPTTNLLHDGMSLRDWFAGQILASMIANTALSSKYTEQLVAAGAYFLADAMLAEREKEPEHE